MPKKKSYPGHIRQRGEAFEVVLTVAGARHRETLTDMSRDEAEEWARTEYNRLRRRHGAGAVGPMRMSELLDAYGESEVPKKAPNTRTSYRLGLRVLHYFFTEVEEDPRADRVRPLHVQRFVDWRSRHTFRTGKKWGVREARVGARTVAKDRTMLHIVFSWAEALEIVDRNPVARVDPPRQDPRQPVILSDDQFESLLEACDRAERPFLWL